MRNKIINDHERIYTIFANMSTSIKALLKAQEELALLITRESDSQEITAERILKEMNEMIGIQKIIIN